MEIVILEREAFDALINGIQVLTAKVGCLSDMCQDKGLGKWIDNETVCRMLRISPRTLQYMRDTRSIPFTQINRKFYYRPEDIRPLLNEEGKEA